MLAVMQSYSFWNISDRTFNKAGRGAGIRVSGLHKAKDGYLMFSLPAGRITDWFTNMLDVEELTEEAVVEWVSSRTVEEAVHELAEIGVPVGAVLDLDQSQQNPQALAREMFVKVQHPVLGELTEPGFPIKFSETKGDNTDPAPLLGEHNVEVYKRLLDLSEDEVEALRKEGVI